ncbi:MAG: BatA domain-containing protein [Verrucomicrobiales bacterium]|nr:BatA domain-containing protein [Verrucomicrobiales bacterium]MCP5527960.1 BatA domain-containing protein [Verrucomicrobiales bacterium]
MSFLAPLFLLGALSVALPVIFHLVRRTTRKRTPFGSLMFLRPAPPRLRQRNRLENLLLLLLRCAAIGLLALGFARPFFVTHDDTVLPAPEGARLVVLLDTSASMGRGDLWKQATDKALVALRTAKPGDEAAVLTFDREARTLVDFPAWNAVEANARLALAREQLAGINPTQAGTHLDQALIRAAEFLAEGTEAGTRRLRLVLISDLQQGSRLNGLQAHEWPRGMEVDVETVSPANSANTGLQAAGEVRSTARAAKDRVRLRVVNTADSAVEQFRVGWVGPDNTLSGPLVDVHVPPGQSRIFTLALTNLPAGVPRARLLGDLEPFDNEVHLLPPPQLHSTVGYVGGDTAEAGKEELFFVQRAFQATPRQTVEVRALDAVTAPARLEREPPSLLVMTGPPGEGLRAVVRARLAAGATVLAAPRSAEDAGRLLASLDLAAPDIEEVATARHALLGEIDFQHPVFAAFADVRYSDFTKVHFWRHRRLDADAITGARVPARFDDGDPALIEIPAGPGRVLLLTSGWHPADSQLALSSKFVPLLYSVLEYSGVRPPAPAQYLVGDRAPLSFARASGGGTATVVRPDGAVVSLVAGAPTFGGTDLAGVYVARLGEEELSFAVNLDPLESQTTPMLAEDLAGLGVPTARSAGELAVAAAREVQLHRADMENRQKLWRWLVLATLVILVVETWLAGRGSNRSAGPTEATA